MPARTRRRRSAAAVVGLLGLILTVAAAWAIVAQDGGGGRVVIGLTASHGLHRDELIELGALVGGVPLGIVGLWLWRPRP